MNHSRFPDVIYVGQPIYKWQNSFLGYDNNYPFYGVSGDYVIFEALTALAAQGVQDSQSIAIEVRWRSAQFPKRHWISNP